MYDLCRTHLPAAILARYFSFLLGLSVTENSTIINNYFIILGVRSLAYARIEL